METKATTTEKLLDKTEKYDKTKLELLKLKLVGHSANVVSSLTSKMTMIVLVAFFCFFLFVGLSLYLGYFYFQIHTVFIGLAIILLLFSLLLIITKGEVIKGPMKYLIITALLKEMENTKIAPKKKKVLFDN